MEAFERIATARGLGLLEDSAQALGAVDAEGRKVGSRGNLAAFAFYANKQMTTGEGGMLIPRDANEAVRIRSERNQGRAVDMEWLDHDRLGYNYRLSDVAAAIGVAQVQKLDRLIADRSRVASLYAQALAGVEGVETAGAGEGLARRSWFVYPVTLDEGIDRDAVISRLADAGIPSKAYLPCVHLFPHFRERGWREGQFPVAESVSASSLALPFAGSMNESDVELVAEALSGALGA
jgi:perosamine synthetase